VVYTPNGLYQRSSKAPENSIESQTTTLQSIDQALGDVIDSIGTDRFGNMLARYLAAIVSYDNFIILAYSSDHAPQLLYAEIENDAVSRSLHGAYLSGAYLLDPFFQAHRQKIAPGIYDLLEIAPDQFTRTSYYNTHYRDTEMVDELAAIVYTPGGIAVTACVGKDTSSNRKFTAQEKQNLKQVQKTIVALMNYHWRVIGPPTQLSSDPKHLNNQDFIALVEQEYDIRLTPRQAEVSLQILQGHSSESIGLNLGISLQTVKVFRRQIYQRCRVSSQAELFSLLIPILVRPSGTKS